MSLIWLYLRLAFLAFYVYEYKAAYFLAFYVYEFGIIKKEVVATIYLFLKRC